MSTDLVSWLRSQLDTDEAIARVATRGAAAWRWVDPGGKYKNALVASGWPYQVVLLAAETPLSAADAAHIAANDPAHVLRTVAAHRAILDAYVEADEWYSKNKSAPAGEVHGLRTAVLLVAAIFESRPGFDPSWRAG